MGGQRRDQKKFNELVKELKDKKFKYVHKEEKVIDWGKYDKAQIHEVNDMLLLIADYVDEATKRLGIEKKPNKDPGRPTYPPDDVAKAVLMQQYFCYANWQSEGLVILFNEKMRIKTLFSHKTIERGYQDPFVTLILNEVFKMTQEPISEKEHSFSIDGTCLPTSIKQNWENDKQKFAKEKAQKEKEEEIKKGKLKERAEPDPTKESEKMHPQKKLKLKRKRHMKK